MIKQQIEEMKCFNCIHAPICMAQKGGVNLQFASENDCCYYQPKLPEGSVVLTQEEYDNAIKEMGAIKAKIREMYTWEQMENYRKETVREVGKWLKTKDYYAYECSCCGAITRQPHDNYCYNCGAKMTEEN